MMRAPECFVFAYRYKTTKTNFQPMPTYKRSTRNRNRTRTRTHNRGGGQTIVERIQKRWFGENEKWQAKLNKLEASLHETRDKMARVARENKNLIDKAAKQATRTKKQTERDRKNAMYMGVGGVTIGALAGAGVGAGGMRRHLEQAKLAEKSTQDKNNKGVDTLGEFATDDSYSPDESSVANANWVNAFAYNVPTTLFSPPPLQPAAGTGDYPPPPPPPPKSSPSASQLVSPVALPPDNKPDVRKRVRFAAPNTGPQGVLS